MFDLNTVTEYQAKNGRKRINISVEYKTYEKLLVMAAMKSNNGEKSTVAGIVNYAVTEFLEKHDDFVKEMYEFAKPYGIYREDDTD